MTDTKGNKIETRTVKIPAGVKREIEQFAVSRDLTIGEVIRDAWLEYVEAHNIVIPQIQFDAVGSTKKKRAG